MDNLTKNNKLLAEFMGLYTPNVLTPQPRLKDYHTSWEWLMPVVIKILNHKNKPDFTWAYIGEALVQDEVESEEKNIRRVYREVCNAIVTIKPN